MRLVKNVVLYKKALSVLVQIILSQTSAYGMQILDRPYQKISVNSELLKACVGGDRLRVISLLAKGADANAKDISGLTALHFAVGRGDKETVELLIANGANVNARSKSDETALHCATSHGYKEIAELLIAKGADAKAKDISGLTALYYAVLKGHKEITELLIANGADINATYSPGLTALHDAAQWGRKEITELLIAKGADINAKDNNGWTALHYAACDNHKEITELLIVKKADANAKDKNGLTALYYAVLKGHKEITKVLIAKGAELNAKDIRGMTALHYAAFNNYKEIAKQLIAKKAAVNSKDINGKTALHYAAFNNREEIAELLIAKQADVNAKDINSWTPLYIAVMNNHKEIAKLLIANAADVNAKDNPGWTALYVAAYKGHKEIAEMLVAKGADVNAKDKDGRTALHLAMETRDLEMAHFLIMSNADLTVRDNQGQTPFQIASKKLKDALLPQSLMRLLQMKKGMILLTDLRLWLHTDYPIVVELQKLAEERKSLLCSTMQNKPLEVSSQTPDLLPQEIPLYNGEQEQAHFGEKYTREFNGLALDGEGFEALITASMVKTLEEELKYPLYKLFDCIVGTSFGGIVALGLVASKDGDCPLLGTDDLIKFVAKYHNDILTEKLKIKNDGDPLRQELNALFKGSRLSDALTRVIVPCKKKFEAFDFDSREAQKRAETDYYIRDVACALAVDASTRFSDVVNRVTASSEYKNKAAELLFKKMDDYQTKKLHILYCASNAQDEGHNRIHNDLTKKLNVSSVKYCRIIPENTEGNSFDSTDLLALYKEKGHVAAEKFLAGNEFFIRILQENRANKHSASL